MTSPVMQALENARIAEQRNHRLALTAAVWKRLGVEPPRGDASEWPLFRTWCERQGIAALGAPPVALAAFVIDHAGLGERLVKVLDSVGAVHELEGLSSPSTSPLVIEALHQVLPSAPAPNGWPKNRKLQFARLDRDLQQFIIEHETTIIKEMRRAQNASTNRKENQNEESTRNEHGRHQATTAAATAGADDAADAGRDRDETPT